MNRGFLVRYAIGVLSCVNVTPALCQGDAARSREEQVEAARATFITSMEAMRRGELRWGERVRGAASALAGVELYEEAIAALNEVVARSDSPFELMSAYRMIGQDRLALGDPAAAEASFQAALAVVNANPELESRGLSFASVISQYASLLNARGDFVAAAAINQRLVESVNVEQDIRAGAFVNQSRFFARADRREDAAQALDRVFSEFPSYVERRGPEIALRLKRAEYRDPDRTGDAWLQELRSMWAEVRLRADPNIITVGEFLIDATGARGCDDESLQTAIDVVLLIEAQHATWTAPDAPRPAHAGSLRDSERSALSVLSSAEGRGRPDLAYWALDRLIARSSSLDERANYQRHKEALDHKLLIDAQLAREREQQR